MRNLENWFRLDKSFGYFTYVYVLRSWKIPTVWRIQSSKKVQRVKNSVANIECCNNTFKMFILRRIYLIGFILNCAQYHRWIQVVTVMVLFDNESLYVSNGENPSRFNRIWLCEPLRETYHAWLPRYSAGKLLEAISTDQLPEFLGGGSPPNDLNAS